MMLEDIQERSSFSTPFPIRRSSKQIIWLSTREILKKDTMFVGSRGRRVLQYQLHMLSFPITACKKQCVPNFLTVQLVIFYGLTWGLRTDAQETLCFCPVRKLHAKAIPEHRYWHEP